MTLAKVHTFNVKLPTLSRLLSGWPLAKVHTNKVAQGVDWRLRNKNGTAEELRRGSMKGSSRQTQSFNLDRSRSKSSFSNGLGEGTSEQVTRVVG